MGDENAGLGQLEAQCKCTEWARCTDVDLRNRWSEHNSVCPMHPDKLLRDLLKGIREWASDCDGVHYAAWEAYRRLCLRIDGKMPDDETAQSAVTP